MNELDAVVQVLHNKCSIIYNKPIITQNDEGDVGELFCKYGVKQSFFNKDFYAISGSNKTFTIEEQINPSQIGMGGIDFFSKFEIKSKLYKLFIEMKNWKHFWKGIPPATYNKQILDRFKNNDPQRNRYWILTINKNNIRYLKTRCNSDNINIVPIEDKIIPTNINQHALKPIFEKFVDDFSILVDDIISGKVQP
jgi:hypothetical protein